MLNGSISQNEVMALLDYNKETGVFRWKVKNSRNVKNGAEAGYICNGYRRIRINKKAYAAHRLAWLYVYSEWPEHEIDHVNHIRDDNRIENLRSVTTSGNQRNVSIRKDNSSGFTGVSWCCNKWKASIEIGGKNMSLGHFLDKVDAISAREAANIKYGFHQNHGRAS